jgi:hypothetical protein
MIISDPFILKRIPNLQDCLPVVEATQDVFHPHLLTVAADHRPVLSVRQDAN